ncbi:hypothetical protein [Mixta hanseatica]|uniref:Uncharacterized protein n=1 Tax=Mixta hanseatica TaxID=2872648 RepID=A0ABY4R8F2_9GAMM|nr:hypothetical protein [Mixta hanseatica]UQY44399.1 hypothetical protein K6958_01415 [Mixta hanseatica]
METIAEMATAIAVAAVVPAMEAAGATEVEVAMEEMAEMAVVAGAVMVIAKR